MVLDMLGQPCPIPVVKAKRELEKQETEAVTVLVDNSIAVQNLEKMAVGLGFSFSYEKEDDNRFEVFINKAENMTPQNPRVTAKLPIEPSTSSTAVLIKSDKMGEGAEELGKILMKGFIFSLTELDCPPAQVVFLNSGVNLVTEGSNTIEDIKRLSEKGTVIYICGTCLNFYGLTEKLAVGSIVDMYQISQTLSSAGKVISL